jgi:RNA-directed DNA polymerase
LSKEKNLDGEDRDAKWVFSAPSDVPNSPVAAKHELWKHAWTVLGRHIKIDRGYEVSIRWRLAVLE